MAGSIILKLFQKLIKAYTEVHKEKNGKDVQLEVSAEWKEMKKLKDSDLEVADDKNILKKKVQSMEIWSKFVGGNVKKQETFRW